MEDRQDDNEPSDDQNRREGENVRGAGGVGVGEETIGDRGKIQEKEENNKKK